MSSEQIKKRNENRYTILRGIQTDGPMRRTDLARKYHIRKSSITTLAKELVDEEILCGRDPEKPKSPLTFTKGKWFAAVADLQVEEIKFARIDLSGGLCDRKTLPIDEKTATEIQQKLKTGLAEMVDPCEGRCLGLGVSSPGVVNPKEGVCLYSFNLPHLRNALALGDLSDSNSLSRVKAHAHRRSPF